MHLRKQKAAVKHSQTTTTFNKKPPKQQGQPGATILYMQKKHAYTRVLVQHIYVKRILQKNNFSPMQLWTRNVLIIRLPKIINHTFHFPWLKNIIRYGVILIIVVGLALQTSRSFDPRFQHYFVYQIISRKYAKLRFQRQPIPFSQRFLNAIAAPLLPPWRWKLYQSSIKNPKKGKKVSWIANLMGNSSLVVIQGSVFFWAYGLNMPQNLWSTPGS